MSATEYPGAVACPGCLAAPVSRAEGPRNMAGEDVVLSLPAIHCAACIATLEGGLAKLAGVTSVRVNLTRKRATVRVLSGTTADQLVTTAAALGYAAVPLDGATLGAGDTDQTSRDLAMRLGVAGFAMMNVMLLSVAVWSGATDATRDMFHWISAAIALPTVAFAGQPFFRSGFMALRVGRLNMDVPISLAILLATGMSLFETSRHGDHAYFDAALSLTFFLLAGRYLDQRMRRVARSAAAELAAMEPATAVRISNTGIETVRLADVAVGDRLRVLPGARVPVDGLIEEGRSDLDRSSLTGETLPVLARTGDAVTTGELNLTGPLTIRATAVGKDTMLHQLADLVSVAEEAKSRYASLADRAARIYAPLVHLMAFSAFVVWLWITGGDARIALNIAVAVLIITCPCALGLAVPAVSTVASGKLFRDGLLIKHATALERLAEVDEVVFDKTGTLTLGVPKLANADALSDDLLAIAAGLAAGSAHPRSRAVLGAAAQRGIAPRVASDIVEAPGDGVSGRLDGVPARLGRASWAGAGVDDEGTVLSYAGQTVCLEFIDTVRPGAVALVAAFRDRGIPMTLLSGDAQEPVTSLARALGIPASLSGHRPADKVRFLQDRSKAGRRVLMIGDGLNDVGAMTAAHVAIAPASALEAARVAADIVLLSPDLSRVAGAMRIAQSARRRIIENFALAAAYNMVAVPIAFAGFATPLAAAIAMSTSSILVSLNALRVR